MPNANATDETRPGFSAPNAMTLGKCLRLYFGSGWAFLVPYLATYLAYAALRWPINSHPQKQTIFQPVLLHVYWLLHLIHLGGGWIALRSWWVESKARDRRSAQTTLVFWQLIPWLCLLLLVWTPGVYLEWPADPWEHLSRINQWRYADEITSDPTWLKSSYFLAYSLVGEVTSPLQQLRWISLWYVGSSLLLCWQYYRLAIAVGLGRGLSLLFVFIQAMFFGNGCFNFYRYYGLASTCIAQICVLAFVRTLVVVGSPPFHAVSPLQPPRKSLIKILHQASNASILLALVAFNHVQGLGLAGFGALAVVLRYFTARHRTSAAWIVLGCLVLSIAAILWLPRQPAVDEVFVPGGWFSSWYGFNLFQLGSPACNRSTEILGSLGLLNIAAGLWLLRRNHIVGWLTFVPPTALMLPCFAIPMANLLVMKPGGEQNIVTFHRMLLAIPTGLAVVVLVDELSNRARPSCERLIRNFRSNAKFACLVLCVGLTIVAPCGAPVFNRAYSALAATPADLELQHLISESETIARASLVHRARLIGPQFIGFVADAFGVWDSEFDDRLIDYRTRGPELVANAIGERIAHRPRSRMLLYLPFVTTNVTAGSTLARLSRHWEPRENSLNLAGSEEWAKQVVAAQWVRRDTASASWYFYGDWDIGEIERLLRDSSRPIP